MRAIRLCLNRPDLMKTQLRAILRAGLYGNIKILYPMVSSLSELDSLQAIMDSVKAELTARKEPFHDHLEIGIMIEIPAAALIADQLAKRVDFFSIGTNDLVQYTLAVDRSNEKVAYLYNPMHPAVIDLMSRTVKAARENNIWVSCCGELAGDPRFTPLLVGLGIQELSMNPNAIGPVRRIIRRMSMLDAETLVQKIQKDRDSNTAYALSKQ